MQSNGRSYSDAVILLSRNTFSINVCSAICAELSRHRCEDVVSVCVVCEGLIGFLYVCVVLVNIATLC